MSFWPAVKIGVKSKGNLILEIIELRQQLAAYKAKNIRPKSNNDMIRSGKKPASFGVPI